MWDSQDHVKGKRATGIITFCDKKETKLANVQWAGGAHQAYRIGADSAFDLSIKGINENSLWILMSHDKYYLCH